jgi:hypothetical protein
VAQIYDWVTITVNPDQVRIGNGVSVRFLDPDNETSLPVFAPEEVAAERRG